MGDAFPGGRTRGLARLEDDVLGVRCERAGTLQVLRSLPRGAPHQGVVGVAGSGDIAAALHAYFLESEQVTTRIGFGISLDGDDIAAAGGYVVQLLPEVTQPPLDAIERALAGLGDLAAELVQRDADPQWLLDAILGDTPYTALAASEVAFSCHCGREKAIGAVAALGEADLRQLLADAETTRVQCDYCRTAYEVGPDDYRRILEQNPPE